MPKQEQPRRPVEPKPGPPRMPKNYGVSDLAGQAESREWAPIRAQLSEARNYWVGTAGPTGRPHAAPVWGLWIDETFWFSTDRHSRKARNLLLNPEIVVHLESGDDVVILEGVAEEVTGGDFLSRFVEAYEAKYRFRPDTSAPGSAVYALRPRLALTWQEKDFPGSATRWVFELE